MNKLFLQALTLLCASQAGFAQAPVDSASTAVEALPPGPLVVHKMPAFSQWTVDYTYKEKPKPGEVSASLRQWQKMATTDHSLAAVMADPHFLYSLDPARPLRVVVTKTGKIRNEEWVYERGLKGELWSDSQITVQERPEASKLIVTIQPAEDNEFAELGWLSKEGFKGIVMQQGHKCLVFKQQEPLVTIEHPELRGAGDPDGPKVQAVAWIDLDTRYPLFLQVGNDVRAYNILPPPSVSLSIPPAFAAAAKDGATRALGVKTSLAPP